MSLSETPQFQGGDGSHDLLEIKTEREYAEFGRKAWEAATECPDPAYAKRITEAIRQKLGISDDPYISLHGGNQATTIVLNEFVSPHVQILEKDPAYSHENGLDRLLQGLETNQDQDTDDDQRKIVYIQNDTNPSNKRAYQEKLQRLAEITERKHGILVIDDGVSNDNFSLKLTEKYSSVMVIQSAGLPGVEIGWTVMSEELGKYYKHLEVPYSPRGIQLAFLKTIFPPASVILNDQETEPLSEDYIPPIRSDLVLKTEAERYQKAASGSYVHERMEPITDPIELAKYGIVQVDVSRGELKHKKKPNLFGSLDSDATFAEFAKRMITEAQQPPDLKRVQQLKKAIKEYTGSSEETDVKLSGNGSDELLRRIVRDSRMEVLGNGPQFSQIVDYAGDLGYTSVQPESLRAEDGIDELIKTLERMDPNEKRLVYVCNPATPLGDTVPIEKLKKLAEVGEKGNHILVIDEAFIHSLPKEESAITFPNTWKRTMVLQSTSKVLNLPSVLGWAVMSEELAQNYNSFDDPHSLSGPQLAFAEELFKDDVIDEYLAEVVPEIHHRKRMFLEELSKRGLQYLPTDTRTTILSVLWPAIEDVAAERFIMTAEGGAFSRTHKKMTDWVRRITVPMDDAEFYQVLALLEWAYEEAINRRPKKSDTKNQRE